jgi:hypothetical protein
MIIAAHAQKCFDKKYFMGARRPELEVETGAHND